MRRRLRDRRERLEQERLATWWRVWGMLKKEIVPRITGTVFWQEEIWEACLKALAERPRRRQLSQLPSEAIALLYHWDES